MKGQLELWTILENEEYDKVWDRVFTEFKFQPSTELEQSPFQLSIPVNAYDISISPIWSDNEHLNNIVKQGFISCMGDADYMYALDWQHTCYRYNPNVTIPKENPTFINDTQYAHGGYYAYFPEFYPNGDYYFFISVDFSWGYLTHPWLKKVWVFGESLMTYFHKYATTLEYIPCSV